MTQAGNGELSFAAPCLDEEEIAEVTATLRAGWVTMGPRTRAFEERFAEYVGVPYARAVNSCTAALHLMLVALGVGPGDEVIIPSLTFAATGNVVDHVGASTVFADVDPHTWNVTAETIAPRLTSRTKAVILVHYAGLACDIEAVKALCKPRGIAVMEDAAHAVGTVYRGRPIGSHTEGVSFSFYANKNMTTGEGGMLTTSDEELAKRIEVLRLHGMSRDAWKRYSATGSWRYDVLEAGFKYNMSDINAALGLVQLRKLEKFIARRNAIARRYRRGFAELEALDLQSEAPAEDRHAYHLFAIRLDRSRGAPDRELVMNALRGAGVPFSVHFIPLHSMSCYASQAAPVEKMLPMTETLGEELLSLPMHPGLSDADVDRVIEAVRGALDAR